MSGVDRRPAPAAGRFAVLGALVVVVAGFVGSVTAAVIGVPGFVLVVVGIRTGRRLAITAGATFLLASTLAAGVLDASIPAVVVATIGTVLAWDMGRTAIDMGHQLGTAAVSSRPASLHAVATVVAGSLSAGIGYGVYRGTTSGQPAIAVIFLLLSVVVLVYVLE